MTFDMDLKVIDGGQSRTKIAELLTGYSFNFVDEKELQEAIAQIFAGENIPFEREVAITDKDRIDFMVGPIGIEIKIAFSFSEVVRQLHRYAQHDSISELILVTMKSQHQMPDEINDKKLTTVNLAFTHAL